MSIMLLKKIQKTTKSQFKEMNVAEFFLLVAETYRTVS